MYRLCCFFFCFFDVLDDVVKGDRKLSCARMAFDTIIMPLDDVCKCGDAEIIAFLFEPT